MIKAIGYCRFSSANQRDESIDAQKRAIKYYAAEQGYEIIQFYEDRAKSGKNSQRPAFQQMMSDIKNGDICITAVLVHKLDRFSRDLADSLFYQQQLQDSNIELVSVMERLDASPTGNLMKTIIGAINSFYVENLASETMKGLKENAYNCITTGGTPPLGYDFVDKKYVINPKEAEAVKLAFTMYDEAHGYLPIIRRLNLLGYTTKTGRNFSKSGLYEIFRNERYKGTYTYNKAQKRRRDGSRGGKSKPDDQIIRIEGGVPAIVDSDVWDRVNAMMNKRKKTPGSAKAKHTYLYRV